MNSNIAALMFFKSDIARPSQLQWTGTSRACAGASRAPYLASPRIQCPSAKNRLAPLTALAEKFRYQIIADLDHEKYTQYPPPKTTPRPPLSTTKMPVSRRQKVVHLTQVDKKGKELTLKLFANVQESVDKYQYCFVFSVENMRNTYLKKVRAELSDSR